MMRPPSETWSPIVDPQSIGIGTPGSIESATTALLGVGRLDAGPAWLQVVGIVLASILLTRAIQLASRWYLDREDAETTFGRAAITEIHTPLAVSIGLLGVYLSLVVIGLIESTPIVVNVISTALIVLWGRALIRIIDEWVDLLQSKGTSYEFAPMFENLLTISIVASSGLVLLSIWDIDLTPFLASAGILGIVVGFAARDAISNLIGGIALYFDNTYKVGDVIRLEDEMRGTVMDVGIRSTTVLTKDNLFVTVPNALLNSTQVVNESAPQRHVRVKIPVRTAYGTDHEHVESLILDVCRECPMVRETPRPTVLFSEFGESALVFEVRIYINHPLIESRAVDQVNRGIYSAFAKAGVKIPYPQRELTFSDDQPDTHHSFDERVATDKPAVDRD